MELHRLRPFDENPRQLRDRDRLRRSLKRWGCVKPLLVEPYMGGYLILAGNQRTEVARDDLDWAELPAFVTPRLNRRQRIYMVQTHNRLYELPDCHDPDSLTVPPGEIGSSTQVDVIRHRNPTESWDVQHPRRVMEQWQRVVHDCGYVGSIVAHESGRIIDGHLYAVYCMMAGYQPLTYYIGDDPNDDFEPAGDWAGDFGLAAGRHTRVRFRRVSPLYRRMLDDGLPADKRVLDIGCGYGRHFALLPDYVKPYGYEPWINPPEDPEHFDMQSTYMQVVRIAASIRRDGLFPRIVADHSLFATQREEITEAIVRAASTMLDPAGKFYVSQRTPAGMDRTSRDGWMVGSSEGRQYLMRSYTRDELETLLSRHFGVVKSVFHGDLFFTCSEPKTTDLEAVRMEFDLPYPDGRRHGAGDELVDALQERIP